ncbi:hypothetical protein F300043A5_09990 [Massilimicrobiota timonensis]|uniref:transposase n=1 Tax=Massilimicrobiota timonensis TaxID=1776392 RepID=UPI0036F37BE7
MVKIISLIIHFLNIIKKLLYKFECFLLKFLPSDPNHSSSIEAYRRFKVHPLPVLEPEHLPIPFDEAKAAYVAKHNKPLKPVFRHEGKVYPPKGTVCPHCGSKLSLIKSRNHFDIYKCSNPKCSHYKKELKKLSKEDKAKYKQNPSAFSLHYITRVFNASLDMLERVQLKIKPSKVDLSRIRNSRHVLGLALTYYVNYGLSLRKTALILYEVHDIKISHQTIANYAQASSHLLFPWMDNFKHDLNDYQCVDETYVKVLGKKAYVFFMCDVRKKIITSYRIYMNRDTFSAIDSFYSVLRKFKEIPENLEFVVDGNPIYKAAQQYFQLNRIFFKVTQVIGLTNDDPVSKEHRPAKQIIERLNRTFKYSYAIKNGFNSLESANDFMCLFTTYFNFLRNHTTLGYKPPVELDCLKKTHNMPSKWNILLDEALNYYIESTMEF